MEITVDVHKNWLENESTMMSRIADVVVGEHRSKPTEKSDGYRWSLCPAGNDWWAEIKDGKLVVAYRYGQPEFMEALKVVLTWVCR